MTTSFGATHNLSFQQLVFYAVNDARLALVNGKKLGEHVEGLYAFARPLAMQHEDHSWLDAWKKLASITPAGRSIGEQVRHRQFVLLVDLFWKHNILSLRGVPFAEMGDVRTWNDVPTDEQEEWEP
jgi:hypothetical protein